MPSYIEISQVLYAQMELRIETAESRVAELESKLALVEVKPCEYFAAQVADCLGFDDVPKLMGPYLSRACEVVARVAELEGERALFGPIEIARDELKKEGLDPDEIGRDGASFVRALQAEAKLAELEKSQEWNRVFGGTCWAARPEIEAQNLRDRSEALLSEDDEIIIPEEGAPSPCGDCGEEYCDICNYKKELAVRANPCKACKGTGLGTEGNDA